MLSIMIIDDNVTFGQMLADMLKTEFSSSVANLGSNHPDLMDEFIMNLPEIVFIDVQSMGKKCLNVAKSFKSYHPGLCIIWITSHDQPEYIQKAHDSGIDYCLSKNSITMDSVVNLIHVIRRTRGI